MRTSLLPLPAAWLALGLACSGSSDTRPPPPPPPEGVVVPALVVPPPAVVPPAADARLLPPPWGDLGLGYAGTTVLIVEPSAAVLVTTSVAAQDAVALFAAWSAALMAAGFTATPAIPVGDDTLQLFTLGERRIAIAQGIVDTTAYVMVEDQQQLPNGAIAAKTTDGAVKLLLTARAPPAADGPVASGKKHPFGPGRDKVAGKKGGGKLKGKKHE